MPFKIDDKTKSRVEALLPLYESNSELLENLKKSGPTVSLSSLKRLRRLKRLEVQGVKKSPTKRKKHGNADPDQKSHIRKIKRWTGPETSLSISEMARRLEMSRGYVRNILKNNFGVHQVKKRKVQELTDKQKATRYERGKKFLKKYLTRRKLKLLFTMDEMMIRSSDLQGESNFYYKGRSVVVPESLRKLPRKNWPQQILIAMGICWYGKSLIYVVPAKTKVNAKTFINSILKPMITYDIHRLSGKKKRKVIFHVDSAPSHRAAITNEFFWKQKVMHIPAQDWMPYSPDMAPMDFAINGNLKRNVKRRAARGRVQLVRAVRYEWSKLKIATIRRALRSWPKRVKTMVNRLGDHVEHGLS